MHRIGIKHYMGVMIDVMLPFLVFYKYNNEYRYLGRYVMFILLKMQEGISFISETFQLIRHGLYNVCISPKVYLGFKTMC